MTDSVNHPAHYTEHPSTARCESAKDSGVECIQITEHMGFNLGNAMKYIWRADLKGSAIEDLEKARWYIDRELTKRVPSTEPLVSTETGPWQRIEDVPKNVMVRGGNGTWRGDPDGWLRSDGARRSANLCAPFVAIRGTS